MTEPKILTFEEFQRFLSQATGLRIESLAEDASLLNDLALDSLKLVELILQFELKLGLSVSSDAAWSIETVGDAYRFYAEVARRGELQLDLFPGG